jgi:hypothetical protein
MLATLVLIAQLYAYTPVLPYTAHGLAPLIDLRLPVILL